MVIVHIPIITSVWIFEHKLNYNNGDSETSVLQSSPSASTEKKEQRQWWEHHVDSGHPIFLQHTPVQARQGTSVSGQHPEVSGRVLAQVNAAVGSAVLGHVQVHHHQLGLRGQKGSLGVWNVCSIRGGPPIHGGDGSQWSWGGGSERGAESRGGGEKTDQREVCQVAARAAW